MESQRIVFLEELHHCGSCERLVIRATRSNGTHDKLGCACENEDTEILSTLDFGMTQAI